MDRGLQIVDWGLHDVSLCCGLDGGVWIRHRFRVVRGFCFVKYSAPGGVCVGRGRGDSRLRGNDVDTLDRTPAHVTPTPTNVIPTPTNVIPTPTNVIPAKAGIWRDGGDAYSLAIRANESNGTPRRKELD